MGSSAPAGLFDDAQGQPAAGEYDDVFGVNTGGPKKQSITSEIATEQKYTSVEWLNKAIELEGKNDSFGLLNHALSWTKALPGDAKAWYNLGIAYGKSDQLLKAIEAYQQAIRINPEYTNAWYNLGIAYDDSNQFPKAIEAYQQAIRINPQDADAWNALGIAYDDSNQFPKAIEALQQAIRINLQDANAWYNLGVAYKNSGQTSQVMDVYKHLKSLDPAKADDFFNNFVMLK